MDEIDFEGVDPLRQAEVGRRVEIIKSYLALTKPTRTQTAEYATMIGLGIPQFYRLVRSWRLHRKPRLLAGAGTRGSKRTRRDGLPAETKTLVNKAIEQAAADAREADIFRSIVERCDLAGLEPPSRGAVWTYIMEARSAGITRLAGPRRLLVARCWPKLPTLNGQGPIFPELAVAVLLPDRRILGWDVSCEAGRPARPGRALAQAFAALGRTPHPLEVVLDAGDSADAYDVYLAVLGRPPKAVKTSTSQELSRALGWAIGGLRILYKGHTASVVRLLGTSKNQPLACHETERQIVNAIEVHNAGLATDPLDTTGGATVPPNVSTSLSAL